MERENVGIDPNNVTSEGPVASEEVVVGGLSVLQLASVFLLDEEVFAANEKIIVSSGVFQNNEAALADHIAMTRRFADGWWPR